MEKGGCRKIKAEAATPSVPGPSQNQAQCVTRGSAKAGTGFQRWTAQGKLRTNIPLFSLSFLFSSLHPSLFLPPPP